MRPGRRKGGLMQVEVEEAEAAGATAGSFRVLESSKKGRSRPVHLFFYASFFEWVLHRFLMHQPIWSYPFRSHALIHHGVFRSGPTYFLLQDKNLKKIRFAWWNAPLILSLH